MSRRFPKVRPGGGGGGVPGLTLDSGALIAFEKRKRRLMAIVDTAAALGMPVRTSVAAVAETWRGEHSRAFCELVEATVTADTLARGQRAGKALASIGKRPSVVDAMVAALASERGDQILTSDLHDLQQLAAYFGNLRVLAV